MNKGDNKRSGIILKAWTLILVLCLTAAFSACYYEFKTPMDKELDVFVSYIKKNAENEKLTVEYKKIDLRMKVVHLTFGEVTNLEQTDNIACAVNRYLEENPDSFINKDSYILRIITEKRDVKKNNPPEYFLHYDAHLTGNVIDGGHVLVDQIDVQITSSFPVTDFLKCKTKYNSITFSQNIDFTGLEELAKADGLKSVYLKELDVSNAGMTAQSSTPPLDYESYSRYCEMASRINAEKGFRFAVVTLGYSTQEKWKKEYGSKFAQIEAIPQIGFKLTLNEDYSITRDSHDEYYGEDYTLLCWHIECDGEMVLQRVAVGELVLQPKYQWLKKKTGTFRIYLIAVVNGEYTRVSNIIEYTITEPPVTPAGAGLFMRVNGKSVPVTWEDNVSVAELKTLSVKEGMTVTLTKRNENLNRGLIERVIDKSDANIDVATGDLVLYMGNWLGVCLGPGNGKYTKLGKIDLPENEIKELFSKDDVTITLIWGVP